METIATYTDTAIPAILVPTLMTFSGLLEKKRAEIEGIPCKTFKFGNTDRHQLDVYYPDPALVSGTQVPVLFFVYGGGFTTGARRSPPPVDLVYSNFGAFFAKRGILTVIADYRLVPDVKFPEPVEDVRDAIAWFLANPAAVAAGGPLPSGATLDRIVVAGHSAGANHVSTLYLSPDLLPLDSTVRTATRGLVPMGGAVKFAFSDQLLPGEILKQYYGSEEATLANMPISLLEKASGELIAGLPEAFVLASEHEPPAIRAANDVFVKGLEARVGRKVRYDIMKGHNHISPNCALMTGEGEEWAESVAVWAKEKISQ